MQKSKFDRFVTGVLASLVLLIGFGTQAYETDKNDATPCEVSQFTFSWSLANDCDMKPRGGTSKGATTKLDPNPNPGWLSLQEEGISQFERDRRAILAMAGGYRVSFDFIEVLGYTPEFKPSRPYQSWGTEYVYVVEDKGDFISLQHLMVMYFTGADGKVSKPMVMKHWRQDWKYQNRTLFEYVGHDQWQRKKLKRKQTKGTWSQAVYQVDDSPRYESFGKWLHKPNFSSWKSATTWRPLPRREGSVRSDYEVLEGTNRHTIVPTGWVQEEENLKLVLDKNAQPDGKVPYLAKELGVARYERIIDHDFSAGDEYWQKSQPFWSDVRAVWKDMIKQNKRLKIVKKVDKSYMFMPFFSKAQAVADGEAYNSEQGRKQIREMLKPFVSVK